MIKNLVLVDTSAWVAVDRPRQRQEIKSKVRIILDEDRAATCGIIMAELLSGVKTAREYEELEVDLRSLHYLATPDEIWLKTARLAFDLRKKGITVPFTDILIACIAMENDCLLMHLDNHFDLIASKAEVKINSFSIIKSCISKGHFNHR